MTKILLIIIGVLLLISIYKTIVETLQSRKDNSPIAYSNFHEILDIIIVLLYAGVVLQFIIDGMSVLEIALFIAILIVFTHNVVSSILKKRLTK